MLAEAIELFVIGEMDRHSAAAAGGGPDFHFHTQRQAKLLFQGRQLVALGSLPRISAGPDCGGRFVLTDPIFVKSLVNTFSIFLMSSVPQVIIAVCVAALLDTHLRGRTFWRMSVLLPFVVAPAAAVLIFGSLFADKSGLINATLDGLGLEPIRWHVERWWSHFAIASMVNWRWTGYNALIFLAAMQAVPRDLYDRMLPIRIDPPPTGVTRVGLIIEHL